MALVVNGIRPAGTLAGVDDPARAALPWMIPVGIVGTAAVWLTRAAGGFPPSDLSDLCADVRAVRFDLHLVFGEVATSLGFCRHREQRRHVLADAAMSMFAVWLVEAERAGPAAPGESAGRLVDHWVVGQSLWTVARELSAAANMQRLRRFADELGEAGLAALLRAEVHGGVRVSGAALALLDYVRVTGWAG